MPDGSKRTDLLWDKAAHKGNIPPTGIWFTVPAKAPYRPSIGVVIAVPLLCGALASIGALVRPSLGVLYLAVGLLIGLFATIIFLLARNADPEPPGQSLLVLSAGSAPSKDPQATVANVVAALGWKLAEERPLMLPQTSLRGRVWEFESGITLLYMIGGEGPQHMLTATAKSVEDAERFALMKGAVLAALEGAPQVVPPQDVLITARAAPLPAPIARLTRAPAPAPMVRAPEWAVTPLPFKPFYLPDARAPAREPDALPVGWWASTPRGRDVHGGRRVNPRWAGAIAGFALAAILPVALFGPRSSGLVPFTAINYALAVLVLAPPCIYGFIWYARRHIGELALSYLRIRTLVTTLDSIHEIVDESLKRHLPEVARSVAPNEHGVEWKDVEGKTNVFLWRSKSGGDPLLEVRSTAPPAKVVSFKGAMIAALYGEPEQPP